MANDLADVEPEGIIRLNAILVEETGEPHAIVSRESLESACAKPRNHWNYGETCVANLATELLFGIARNHPFLQGNKRTAFAAMIGFLGVNGYKFMVDDDVACGNHIIEVLEGEATQDSFAEALRAAIEPARHWRS